METPPSMPPRHTARPSLRDLFIPVAILIAGVIVAGSIYIIRVRHEVAVGTGNASAVRPVTPADHIIGNPSAPVTIVEYADLDSSYSKSFQLSMEQLMADYATGGKVAWVFRHFPNSIDHPNAGQNALAAECATSLSNPSVFFRFVDAMQAAAPGDEEFDPSGYGALISQFGIDKNQFDQCMTGGTFGTKIHDDYDNALASGAIGSPFVVLIVHGQTPTPINGALPYKALKQIIDQAVAKAGS